MVQKNISFDYLRAYAIIGVIIIHISAVIVGDFAGYSTTEWLTGNFFNSLFRWSVPIFIMISGALLLNDNKQIEIAAFYKKRAMKVVIPLFFWGSIYYVYKYRYELDTISFESFIFAFLKGPIYYPLWFLYMIIFLYLITPFIKKAVNKVSRTKLKYFLLIWFILISIYNICCFILGKTNLYTTELPQYLGQFGAGFLYIGYYLLGYYLIKFNFRATKLLNVLGLFSLIITFVGTYLISASDNIFGSFFYNYLNFNTVIVSIFIFINFTQINLKSNKIINLISKYSFGIYLIHVLVMEYIFVLFKVNFHDHQLIFTIPYYSILVLSLSFLFSFILSKIPILNKVIP